MKGSSASKPATRLAAAFDGMRGVEERLTAIEERLAALERCWETGLSASVTLPDAPFAQMQASMARLEKLIEKKTKLMFKTAKRAYDEVHEDLVDAHAELESAKRRRALPFDVPEEMLFTTATAPSLPTEPLPAPAPEPPA